MIGEDKQRAAIHTPEFSRLRAGNRRPLGHPHCLNLYRLYCQAKYLLNGVKSLAD